MIDKDKREFGGWWLWILLLIVVSTAVLGVTRYVGLWGGTVVERKVFENSYQRSEGLKAQVATYEAQLAQIRVQLDDPSLDSATKQSIKAQRAAIEVQLRAARAQQ